jgi:hypothetical protein
MGSSSITPTIAARVIPTNRLPFDTAFIFGLSYTVMLL